MPNKSLSRSSLLSFQKYSSLLAGNDPYFPFSSDYELLETEILTGTAASVTFDVTGLGSTYQNLQVRYTSRISETVGGAGTFYVNLNSDTGSNYARHLLRGTGSTVTSGALASTSTPDVGYTAGAESAANVFGAGVLDILDPFESTKNTTLRGTTGLVSGYKEVWLGSVLWTNTAALTSISFDTYGAHNFVAGSRFSIYGIKAA